MKRIVRCSQCEQIYDRTSVLSSKLTEVYGKTAIIRRRECPLCGYRFTTYEFEFSSRGEAVRMWKDAEKRDLFRNTVIRALERLLHSVRK